MEKTKKAVDDDDQQMHSSSKITISTPISTHPVDTGWAWAIPIGSFGIHFFTFGYIRSFGILFLEFQEKYDASSAVTAVISGVQFCVYSLSTLLVVNVVLKRFSIRQSCLIGCFLQCLGIALNGIVPNINYLILTQGVIFGIGFALLYCPCLIIVSQYFNKKRAIATAIATCGVSFGGVTLPVLMRYLVDKYGLQGGLLVLAAIMFNQAVFSSLFTPTDKYKLVSSVTSDPMIDLQKHNVLDSSPQIHLSDINKSNVIYTQINNTSDSEQPSSHFSSSSTRSEESTHLLHDDVQPSHHPSRHSDNSTVVSGVHDNVHNENDAEIKDYKETDPLTNNVESVLNVKTSTNTLENSTNPLNVLLNSSQNHVTSSTDLHQNSYSEMEYETEQKTTMAEKNLVSGHDISKIRSIPTAIINALSTSSLDLIGSVYSLTRLEKHQPVRSELPSEQRVNGHENIDNEHLKKRWRCHVPVLVKKVSFWVFFIYFASAGVASALPAIFIPPLAKEKGMNDISTILLMASALAELFGRLIPGLILHIGVMRPSTVVIAPMAACATLYQFTGLFNDFGTLLAMAIMCGLFTGAFWITQSLIVIEAFGMQRLGPMFGLYTFVVGLSNGASNPISGFIKDVSGTYVATFHYFGALYYLAVLMMMLNFFIRKYNTKTPVAS